MSEPVLTFPERARPPVFSPTRVGAMVTRYVYLLRSSWTRIVDLVYWPALQMITWGFLQTYLARLPHEGAAGKGTMAAGTLIGAILLWDILFRGQIGFSMTFLEEMWSRNIGNLLMSPASTAVEFVLADGDDASSCGWRSGSYPCRSWRSGSSASICGAWGSRWRSSSPT